MKIKNKKIIAAALMFSMIVMYGSVPSRSEAVSFESIKDTISSSDVSRANVTHTIVASTTLAVSAGGYFDIIFPAAFTNVLVGGVTCPTGGSASIPVANTARCTFAAGVGEATTTTFIIAGVTNPSTGGSQLFHIYTKTSGDVQIEHSTFRVAIINSVSVTATVEASLTFSIAGKATSSSINGVTTTGSSTMSSLAFGVLAPGVPKTLGQSLRVTTNAAYGFTVTVQQDHNLLSSNGADIDSFDNGVEASSTALAWTVPTGVLGQEMTYGHFGFTSADGSLTGGADSYGSALYKGFNNSDPIEVMYHNGPSDGLTADIGTTTVAYTVGITALQEAGDYSNTLTYICTPTY
jgi:hypothetical protein